MTNIPMNTTVFPIHRSRHLSMLYRIVMNIINVLIKVFFISKSMFPKTVAILLVLVFVDDYRKLWDVDPEELLT